MLLLMTKSYLQSIREIQQVTGPNMCLASSKFLALKLLGFVRAHATLNDFLRSPWAKRHHDLPLQGCWGGSITEHNAMFNATVLPAAINDATANVKTSGGPRVKFHQGFTYWYGNPAKADTMLTQLTPLVVGVSIHGGTARDHFIVIFRDHAGQAWAIDSWPGDLDKAVAQLSDDFSFATSTSVHMTADADVTSIPCGMPFFGYFG
jgi:hypothetical protein